MTATEYSNLILSFLDNTKDFDSFKAAFEEAFDEEEEDMDENLFFILDGVWGSLQSYWPDIAAEGERAHRITGETLRKELAHSLHQLSEYASKHPGVAAGTG